MPSAAYATCCLCDALCGLVVRHEAGRVLDVRGDPDDVFSRGYLCPKGVALADVQNDPDRVREPLRRTSRGFEPVSWDVALDDIADRIAAAQRAGGRDAAAFYIGNPTAHSYSAIFFALPLLAALGTRNLYSSNSVDSFPRLLVSYLMYGAQTVLPIPDIDHTDFLLVLGANPLVSNGSIMTAPDCRGRLRTLRERGGRLVVVDPRRTETAEVADEHVFIRPGGDAYLLLGLLHTIFAEGLARPGRLRGLCDDYERIEEISRAWPPERVEGITGVSATRIRALARAFATARRAVCYGRMGTCVQTFGATVSWLIDVLNIVTGHFDRPGGAMFPEPAVDLSAAAALLGRSGSYAQWHSRVRGLPEVNGEFPVATLADEIETPGRGQIRALLLHAGNPVLSAPNGPRLERALATLDLMVCFDLYVNETTRHAHYILPPSFGLEHDHYGLLFHAVAVRNTARYSPAVVAPPPGVRHDWETLLDLTARVLARRGVAGRVAGAALHTALARLGPRGVLDLFLRAGGRGGLTLAALERAPHGVDLGPLAPRLPGVLRNRARRIRLAPPPLVADLTRLEARLAEPARDAMELLLIGRRQLRSNNSWMHNSLRLVRGRERCTLLMHPTDARRRGLVDGAHVRIASRTGAVEAKLEVSDTMLEGVVSLPHGWGHGGAGTRQRVAAEHAGVSVNALTDETVFDAVSGVSALNGVSVTVTER